MTTENSAKGQTPTEADSQGHCALGDGYAPSVGDHFYRPAQTRNTLLDADPVTIPERNAIVMRVSHSHVVAWLDGKQCVLPRLDFIHLAERALANGSTLTRSHNTDAVERRGQ